MSIIAIDPVANIDFVPESEKRKKEPTTFIIRPLKESEKIDAVDGINPNEENKVQLTPSFFMKLLLKTLSGWKNFKDSSGNPVSFNSRNPKMNIDRIPMEIITEMGQQVMLISNFTEKERKNSDGQ